MTFDQKQLSRLFSRVIETNPCPKHGGGQLAVCPKCDRVMCRACEPNFCQECWRPRVTRSIQFAQHSPYLQHPGIFIITDVATEPGSRKRVDTFWIENRSRGETWRLNDGDWIEFFEDEPLNSITVIRKEEMEKQDRERKGGR